MSGHNKWSKIKRQKEATDGQKSKLFGKAVRLITVEAKKSKGNLESPGLRMAIEKAKEVNMPNDNIERAIKKATEAGGAQMEEVMYEAYGPGGTALIIEALTDNRNKTAAEVRHILSKNGYALAGAGAASWAFSKDENRQWVPQTMTQISEEDGEKLNALLEEFESNEDVQEVYTNAE